jgi:hypothetical protein
VYATVSDVRNLDDAFNLKERVKDFMSQRQLLNLPEGGQYQCHEE